MRACAYRDRHSTHSPTLRTPYPTMEAHMLSQPENILSFAQSHASLPATLKGEVNKILERLSGLSHRHQWSLFIHNKDSLFKNTLSANGLLLDSASIMKRFASHAMEKSRICKCIDTGARSKSSPTGSYCFTCYSSSLNELSHVRCTQTLFMSH